MIVECFLVKNLVVCSYGHGLRAEPESIYLYGTLYGNQAVILYSRYTRMSQIDS